MIQSPPLQGKTAIVTGATSGIGLETIKKFAAAGACVIGVGRDASRCRNAAGLVFKDSPNAQLHFLLADLSLQKNIRRLAQEIRSTLADKGYISVDILVNNAGSYADHYHETADGVEWTLAVNHCAPFLLTHELLPLLEGSADARVITVSSESHARTWINPERLNKPLFFYNGLWAYKQSKLANILFTLELNARYHRRQVHAFAVDPGLVNTEIGLKGTMGLSRLVWRLRQSRGVPPEIPARTIFFLASSPEVAGCTKIYWRDMQPKSPSKTALNKKTALELWEKTCAICDINRAGNDRYE